MARGLASLLLIGAALAAGACSSPVGASSGAANPPAVASLQSVTLGMGYVPSVQFAPFYLAQQRDYYRQAGIKVTFSYATSPNLLQLVGAGREDFAIADGTDVIAANANAIPVINVMTMYQRLPVAIFSLRSRGINSMRALRGKTVGIPGRFGSTYVGLLAALHRAGLSQSSVHLKTIGFTQAESVVRGTVDAAVGYSNNEPLMLRRRGYNVSVIEVGTATGLVGPGVIAGRGLVAQHPGLVRRFVQATLRGLADSIASPSTAFALARKEPGLTNLRGRVVADQRAVLVRSISFWHSAATRVHGLGYANPAQWQRSIQTLRAIGQIPREPTVQTIMTNRFSAGAVKR